MTKVEPKKYFDYGQKATDLELNRLEKRLRKEYQQASKEVTEKMNKHLAAFTKKDEAKKALVDSGKLAKDEYIAWRQGQLHIAGRWSELATSLTEDYVNTNKITADMITNHNYDVFALNHNYGAFEVDSAVKISTSWTLYDRHTVEQLVKGNKDLPLKTKMNIPKDMKWNKRQIESAMMQGILQGESIPNIAKRLPKAVGEKNLNGAIRRARTLTTFAQNSGRLDAYKQAAEESGLKMQKCWIATLDARTRDSHASLNGECVNLNKKFSNGLNCPGDEHGPAEEVYNCRCTMISQIEGLEHDLSYIDEYKLEQQKEDFEEWQEKYNNIDVTDVKNVELISTDKFEGTGNVTRDDASEDWFEYEKANAMAEYIRTGEMPLEDIYGNALSYKEREQLAHEANLIQEIGESTKTKDKTLYRGMVMDEDEVRALNPRDDYVFETLSAATTDKKVASIYMDVENAGGEGVPVIFEIQKSDGIYGFKRDEIETVLPKGSEFKVTRNYMDKDGVVHISLYSKKGKNIRK